MQISSSFTASTKPNATSVIFLVGRNKHARLMPNAKETAAYTDELGHWTYFRTASPADRHAGHSVSKLRIRSTGYFIQNPQFLIFISVSCEHVLDEIYFEKTSSIKEKEFASVTILAVIW